MNPCTNCRHLVDHHSEVCGCLNCRCPYVRVGNSTVNAQGIYAPGDPDPYPRLEPSEKDLAQEKIERWANQGEYDD